MTEPPARVPGAQFVLPLGDGVIAGERAGAGDAVLFVHGWGLDRRVWSPQIEALADRFDVIAFDRRGFGATTLPAAIEREPADLIAIADALGIDRFAIVAMSQGVRIALATALAAPERVRALVLQGGPLDRVVGREADEPPLELDDYAALVRMGNLSALRQAWRAHPLSRVYSAAGVAIRDAVIADYDGRDLAAPGIAPDFDCSTLARITVPALVLTGEHESRWRVRAGDVLADRLPDARRAVIARGGHLCNLCNPAEYNALAAAFLAAPSRHATI